MTKVLCCNFSSSLKIQEPHIVIFVSMAGMKQKFFHIPSYIFEDPRFYEMLWKNILAQ